MENNLKKEFTKRDVTRMRNILTKKADDRTQIQTGWEKQTEIHKEGDVWEQDGKKWTIKSGIKQSITKLDELKKLVVLPLCCPNCGGVMKNHEYNKKMWAIHKMCIDCVATMESKIKMEGKWDEYCSNIMNSNKNAQLDYLEQALDTWIDQNDTFVSEMGEVEKWGGGDKTSIYKRVKDQIAELKKRDIYKEENE
jgi:hypothetical protein